MTNGSKQATEAEFDAAMARSGITVPASLRAGTLAGYRELRRLAASLHAPLPAEAEPAAAYRAPTEHR